MCCLPTRNDVSGSYQLMFTLTYDSKYAESYIDPRKADFPARSLICPILRHREKSATVRPISRQLTELVPLSTSLHFLGPSKPRLSVPNERSFHLNSQLVKYLTYPRARIPLFVIRDLTSRVFP